MIAIPLEEGDVAPWRGQLLSTELAIDLGLRANSCDKLMSIESGYVKKRAAEQVKHLTQLREIEQQLFQQREELLRDIATRPLWEHPMIVAAVTFVGTVGMLYTANQVLK
jgi:hypothetical protein